MRGADHEQRALVYERDAQSLEVSGGAGSSIIELLWGAAFQWIAFGCQRKFGAHKEKHEGLARYLRDNHEEAIAVLWTTMEQLRQGAFYGHQSGSTPLQEAKDTLQNIRAWATS